MKKPEYIKFVDVDNAGRKTRRVVVQTTKSGVKLGEISWYTSWRCYVYRPEPDTIFNSGCLGEIEHRVRKMTEDHRNSIRLEVGKP
jgi:hypothetical protein